VIYDREAARVFLDPRSRCPASLPSGPRPAVKFVLTSASFECGAFRIADRDHLFHVRTCELAPAGETTAAPNLREILA
jgi:hypothetical protein